MILVFLRFRDPYSCWCLAGTGAFLCPNADEMCLKDIINFYP